MKQAPLFEIKVTSFFTCDEADIAPSSIALVQRDKSGISPDWVKLIESMLANVCGQLDGGPFTNIRPMTEAEVTSYREWAGIRLRHQGF